MKSVRFLVSSFFAFSMASCSSGSTASEVSAEWQKDVFCLTVHNENTVLATINDYTTMKTGDRYSSVWCKEWSMSGSSHPELTVRYRGTFSDDPWYESRYANCWWIITNKLDVNDVPGSGWSDSFESIYVPDVRDNYGSKWASSHWGSFTNVSAVWFKEWQWGTSGVRCLTVRYRFKLNDDDTAEVMRETKYVGCRYVIRTELESSSDSTSSQTA